MHLHGHSPPPLIYWSRHFHLLKLENVLKYRCWKLYADLHTFVNKQRPDCVHAKSLAPLKFFALVSSRVGGRKNMKFNFVHNWQIHISWQKPQFHPWKHFPAPSNLPLELKTMLCSYLQNGIYILLLLRNTQKTVFILPPSIKVVDFLLLSSM